MNRFQKLFTILLAITNVSLFSTNGDVLQNPKEALQSTQTEDIPKLEEPISQYAKVTPLMSAADEGDAQAVSDLIKEGSDVNGTNSYGVTALMFAAYKGHEKIVLQLLKAGADVNSQDFSGWTALSSAVYKGHENIIAQLLKAGADVNSQDNTGETALNMAVESGHDNVVAQLLKAGANVNLQKDSRYIAFSSLTLLMWAAHKGNENIVTQLLEAGADVLAKDISGETALDKAIEAKHYDIADLLAKKMIEKYPAQASMYMEGIKPNIPQVQSWTDWVKTQATSLLGKAVTAGMGVGLAVAWLAWRRVQQDAPQQQVPLPPAPQLPQVPKG
jgi:ankyrin repeat protein